MSTLLLLHELGGGPWSWEYVLPHLTGGQRVLLPSLRGARPVSAGSTVFSMGDDAQDVLTLLDDQGACEDLWIGAVAASAPVALEIAVARRGLVAGLMLCSPALQVDPDRRHYLAERSVLVVRHGMAAVADQVLERSYPTALRDDQQRFMGYRDRFLDNDPISYSRANQALVDFRVDDRHFAIGCPVLLLAGTEDLLRPVSQVLTLGERFSDARVEVLPSGHLMPVQTPELVASAFNSFMAGRGIGGE